MHIVIEVKHLLWKRRIIGKDSRRIGIYMDSRENGFHGYGLILVSKDPVELGQWKALTERRIDQIDLFQKTEGLLYRSTLSQDPGNKFKLGHIILSVRLFPIVGISNEIKASHSQAFFIYGLIIERIIVSHMGHADHGIVGFHGPLKTEAEGIVPWSDGHLVAKGKFIIQGPAKIKIFCLIGCCCTHKLPPV